MNQQEKLKRVKKSVEELTLKDDLLFKAFFTRKGNERFLKSFLEAVLNIKIQKIKVEQEVSLYKLTIDEKEGRLDVQATIDDGTVIDIEMQVADEKNIEQRTLYYGSRLVAGQLGPREKYKEIKPVVLINILNFDIFDIPEYHTQTITVLKEDREYEVIKEIRYHFIELPKFRKKRPECSNLLECWLALIEDQRGGLVKMAEKKEEIIKEARENIEEILSSKALKEIQEYRWSAILDENSRLDNAREEGREEGIKEGIKEGREGRTIEMAREMKKNNIAIELIEKITGLTKEEINNL